MIEKEKRLIKKKLVKIKLVVEEEESKEKGEESGKDLFNYKFIVFMYYINSCGCRFMYL